MGEEKDVILEPPDNPTSAEEGPLERVYVPPTAIPPKTKVPTLELETVHVQQEDSRHAPTVRLRRDRNAVPPDVVSTNRPGLVWAERDAEPEPPLPILNGDDVREALTQPPAGFEHGDPREAETLSPSELCPPRVSPLAPDTLDSDRMTPRLGSGVAGSEELEAIQSARTLEVRETPPPPQPVPQPTHRTGSAAMWLTIGLLLGALVLCAGILTARGILMSQKLHTADAPAVPSFEPRPSAQVEVAPPAPVSAVVSPAPSVSPAVVKVIPVRKPPTPASAPTVQRPSATSRSEPPPPPPPPAASSASVKRPRAIY